MRKNYLFYGISVGMLLVIIIGHFVSAISKVNSALVLNDRMVVLPILEFVLIAFTLVFLVLSLVLFKKSNDSRNAYVILFLGISLFMILMFSLSTYGFVNSLNAYNEQIKSHQDGDSLMVDIANLNKTNLIVSYVTSIIKGIICIIASLLTLIGKGNNNENI